MEIPSIFELPKRFNKKKFFDELKSEYSIHIDPANTTRKAYYDTFDWRLYNKDLMLVKSSDNLSLFRLSDQQLLYSVTDMVPPVFVSAFPDGPLKKHISPILSVRALSVLFETETQLITVRLLDEMDKTVIRIGFESIQLLRSRSHVFLRNQMSICSVKGYPEIAVKIKDWFVKKQLKPVGTGLFYKALELVKRRPGDYSSKLNTSLTPTTRSDVAMKLILANLLEIMKRNEEGIKNDIDTEFLHDFRVAVRRTRSGLSQIKSVFPSSITDHFNKSFSNLGKLTNQLRDLDVYLLHRDDYRNMLPSVFKDDIDPLFDYLRRERHKELKKIVRGMNSEYYKRILREWEIFLHEPPAKSGLPENAKKPIFELACKRIYKKYRMIIKRGKKIDEESPDERLHELRIDCKKLRYLLEFFGSLFPCAPIKTLIAQLKKLQDNLGKFQDLFVHEQALQGFVMKLSSNTVNSKRTIMAIGSLIDRLDLKKEVVRDQFFHIFNKFSSTTNKDRFKELFVTPMKEGIW